MNFSQAVKSPKRTIKAAFTFTYFLYVRAYVKKMFIHSLVLR